MDVARFVCLTRSLAAAASRRRLLAGLTGALLTTQSATLLGLGPDIKAARAAWRSNHRSQHPSRARQQLADGKQGNKKNKKKRSCPPCKKKKAGKCKTNRPNGTPCENGGQCLRGRCQTAARRQITRTFSNTEPIQIPAVVDGTGPANPYPSTIQVSGLTNGVILDVNVTLKDFNHPSPQEVDIMLAATQIPGRNAIIMSDVGGNNDAVGLILGLDDAAAAGLPSTLVSGTFQPTNTNDGADTFPDPAPPPTGNSLLSTFNGHNPNGTWQLFVVDDGFVTDGSLAEGWSLQITAEVDG